MNLEFSWDDAKRQTNLEKHDVDFVAAARMLASQAYLTEPSRQSGDEEMRWRAIGPLPNPDPPDDWSGPLAVVVFTRRDRRFRIISARRASTNERRRYESQLVRAGPP